MAMAITTGTHSRNLGQLHLLFTAIITLISFPLSVATADDNSTFVPVPGFSGYGQPSAGRTGPHDANSTEYLDAIKNSNATGLFKIQGYNVSQPWTRRFKEREEVDGWTLSVAALEIADPTSQKEPPDTKVGFRVSVKAPDSLMQTDEQGNKRVDAHPSWGMCMWILEPMRIDTKAWPLPLGNKTLTEDASCERYLTPKCISVLMTESDSSYVIKDSGTNPFGSVVQCGFLYMNVLDCGSPNDESVEKHAAVPNSGQYLFGHHSQTAWYNIPASDGVPLPYLNGSVTVSDTFKENRTKEKQEIWDKMVLNVWPVITLMVNATIDPDHPDGSDRVRERQNPIHQLHCVAPNGVGTGRAFTFSGEVPGTKDEEKDESDDYDEDEDKKEDGAGLAVRPSTGLVAVWAWVLIVSAIWM